MTISFQSPFAAAASSAERDLAAGLSSTFIGRTESGEMIVSWICSRSIIRNEVVPERDEVLRGDRMLFRDQLAVDQDSVAAAQVLDKNVVLFVDDEAGVLPGNAQVLEDDVAKVGVFPENVCRPAVQSRIPRRCWGLRSP